MLLQLLKLSIANALGRTHCGLILENLQPKRGKAMEMNEVVLLKIIAVGLLQMVNGGVRMLCRWLEEWDLHQEKVVARLTKMVVQVRCYGWGFLCSQMLMKRGSKGLSCPLVKLNASKLSLVAHMRLYSLSQWKMPLELKIIWRASFSMTHVCISDFPRVRSGLLIIHETPLATWIICCCPHHGGLAMGKVLGGL